MRPDCPSLTLPIAMSNVPEPLRVAILFEYPTLQGGERSMLAVLQQLASSHRKAVSGVRPIRPIALAPGTGPLADELRRLGIEIRPFHCFDESGKRWSRDALLSRLAAAASEVRAGVLHANSLAMGRLTGALSNQITIPTTCHLRDIIGLSAAAVADLNGNCHIVAVSHATRLFHQAQGVGCLDSLGSMEIGAPRPAIEVIHNGIDLNEFRPRPRSGWLRRELDLPDDALLAASIGQIALRKGHDVLARAAIQVADDAPGLHFAIVGERHSAKRESIEFDERLTETLRAAGLLPRLHRLGPRGDVAAILNEVDFLIHPARQEPLGRVLLEAAASGTPIIATSVGGTPEILQNGATARLIPPDDPDHLAAAIREFTSSPERGAEFARKARTEMERRFDIRDAAEAHARFWHKLAE